MKIDSKKRAGAGGRGMRALFSALTCFWTLQLSEGLTQATVDLVLVSWNFAESFQHSDLNEMQIKVTRNMSISPLLTYVCYLCDTRDKIFLKW